MLEEKKMMLSGARVTVTGGAGFIGSHLVDRLMKQGCHVTVIDNLANGKESNLNSHRADRNFRFIRGDINDIKMLGEALRGSDIVFHLACLGVRHSIKHPLENHHVNAEGTLNTLIQAKSANVKRFVYCSSSEIYGSALEVPMKESHPANPCTVYGSSKLAGEAYTRAFYLTYGMETVVVRPFNTYGPRSHHEGDAGEIIPRSIVRALAGEPLLVFGSGRQTRDFTYVEDTAEALVCAASKEEAVGRTLNIGSGSEVSINDIVQKVKEMTGSLSVIENIEDRPGDVLRLFCDASEFSKLTGWKSRISMKDGLQLTIDWFKARPEGSQKLFKEEVAKNWI